MSDQLTTAVHLDATWCQLLHSPRPFWGVLVGPGAPLGSHVTALSEV